MFNLWTIIQWYIRPLVKWFLRKTTRLCELQRICYGDKPGAARTRNVEKSLMLSRTKDVKQVVAFLDTFVDYDRRYITSDFREVLDPSVEIILKAKKINPQLHETFVVSFTKCLESIWSFKSLIYDVEFLRTIPYDSNNREHEQRLMQLWSLMVPHEELENRITKQWQFIGFQGDDPKTDFRGMGLLGLENLVFFAEKYPRAASHVLSHSHHPRYGYTYAIVGINLTSMAYLLLKDGSAKTYMYNAKKKTNIKLFHRFYCYLFYEFDKLWIESKPQDMMEFSIIFKRFENAIRLLLADPSSVFRINIKVDTV